MANDFRLSTGIPNHPKIVKLRRKLGADGALGFIYLLAHCAQFKQDGVLVGMDHEDIAIVAQWPAEPETFVAGLLELRLLEEVDGVLKIHDWREHNPWVASQPERSERARKAAAMRWDAERMRDACPTHAESNAPSPTPSPSPDPSPIPDPKPEDEEPPTSRRRESEWPDSDRWLKTFLVSKQKALNGSHLPELLDHDWWDSVSEAVNGLDEPFLAAEFAKMRGWFIEHPRKMPTPRGIKTFVRTWLQREAEFARRKA